MSSFSHTEARTQEYLISWQEILQCLLLNHLWLGVPGGGVKHLFDVLKTKQYFLLWDLGHILVVSIDTSIMDNFGVSILSIYRNIGNWVRNFLILGQIGYNLFLDFHSIYMYWYYSDTSVMSSINTPGQTDMSECWSLIEIRQTI